MTEKKAALPAFVVVEQPTAVWPVMVYVPVDGKHEQRLFNGTFRVLTEAEHSELFPKLDDTKDIDWPAVLADNATKLPGVMLDWDVRTEGGGVAPISELPKLLVGPQGKWLAAGIRRAIAEIVHGADAQPGAALGNSQPAPGDGSGAQPSEPAPTSLSQTSPASA